MKLRVLDLFSGIGGFSLGLERTGGFQTVAFCEIEEFPRKVLAKHWPGVPIYNDVRELTAERLAADGIAVDVICGGFPCQDISVAGRGAGIAGERSGLWKEYARLIGELRPRYAIMENVSALLSRGLDVVLGDLAEIGYDAEWHCIPASAVGAPHRRDRVWIIANTNSAERRGGQQPSSRAQDEGRRTAASGAASVQSEDGEARANHFEPIRENVAHAHGQRQLQQGRGEQDQRGRASNGGQDVADASLINVKRFVSELSDEARRQGPFIRSLGPCSDGLGWWRTEPDVGRVAHGVPARSHRLKALGNAVVPAIPELIGNAILKSLEAA